MAHFTLHTTRDGRLAFVTIDGDESDMEMARSFSLLEFGVPVIAFGEGVSCEVA